jgi:hypothetical protein
VARPAEITSAQAQNATLIRFTGSPVLSKTPRPITP